MTSDAQKLLAGYVEYISQSPGQLAFERSDELVTSIFTGEPWSIDLQDSFNRQGGAVPNFTAFPDTKKIEVHYSALLSVWAVCRAAYLVSDAGTRAQRAGQLELDATPGSSIHEARCLLKAAEDLIRNTNARWPSGLPVPNPLAAERTIDWYANNVFHGAIGWILLHEIAHISLRHVASMVPEESKRQEFEADQWATEWMLGKPPTEVHTEFRMFAAYVGLIWVVILDNIRRGSPSHPSALERLQKISDLHVTDDLSLSREMVMYVIKVFFLNDAEQGNYDSPEEAFWDTLFQAWRLRQ